MGEKVVVEKEEVVVEDDLIHDTCILANIIRQLSFAALWETKTGKVNTSNQTPITSEVRVHK